MKKKRLKFDFNDFNNAPIKTTLHALRHRKTGLYCSGRNGSKHHLAYICICSFSIFICKAGKIMQNIKTKTHNM